MTIAYWSHVAHSLHDVSAQAVWTIIPGRWEETDQVEVQGATRCFLIGISVPLWYK